MIVRVTRRSALRREAFTLLEVLVVVAILVVLASVAGIYFFRYLEGHLRQPDLAGQLLRWELNLIDAGAIDALGKRFVVSD